MARVPGFVLNVLGQGMAAFRFPKLRRADPHPFGLLPGVLDPVMLGGESWTDKQLCDLRLEFGDPLDLAAPLVTVRTDFPGRGRHPDSARALAVSVHRDQAILRRAWFAMDDDPETEPEPEEIRKSAGEVTASGVVRAVTLASYMEYQTAQFTDEASGCVVTISSRNYPLDGLRLEPIASIEPFLTGYSDFFRRLATVAGT